MIYIDSDIENDEEETVGSIQGYLVNKNEENWKIFLRNELNNESLLAFMIEKIESSNLNEIAIIKNVNVYDEYRGQGYGNDLINLFFDKAENLDIIMLVADKGEDQKDGFSLKVWYESFDFQEVFEQEDIIFMVWDNNSHLCEPSTDIKTEFTLRSKTESPVLKPKF